MKSFKLDIAEMPKILEASEEAGDSVLMIGNHGIGKSDVVRRYALDKGYHCETLFLSLFEVSDLLGIPKNVEKHGKIVQEFSEPDWFNNILEAAERGIPSVLFTDEISRSAADVRANALQLVLEKRLHNHVLPTVNGKKTLIVAADNPDNGMYDVESLDPALINRFLPVEVGVNSETWLDWARKNEVNNIVREFISQNPSKLEFHPDNGETVTATPRSWAMLSNYINNQENIDPHLLYTIMKGKIGSALALQFTEFMKTYTDNVSVEDIENLVNELKTKTDSVIKISTGVKELIQDLEAIQKTELLKSLYEKYSKEEDSKDVYPLMTFLHALEPEILVGFLKKLKEDEGSNNKIVQWDNELTGKALYKNIVKQKKK